MKNTFSLSFKETELIGDILPHDAVTQAVFLHGAGSSERSVYDYLRQPLAKQGIASAAFDCIGQGETGGKLIGSSLQERTDQASTVTDALSVPEPFALLGGSMGAYTAIKLTQLYEVDRLVLMVPGVYREDVYDLPFGDNFTQLIREDKSWENSDAWEILESFHGKLLIVAAENDATVPAEIPQRLYDAAKYADRQLHIVKGAPHNIHNFLADPNNKTAFDECYTLIASVLN